MAVDVPEDAIGLTLEVSDFRGDDGLAWSVFVRSEQPIGMQSVGLDAFGLGFSVPETFDAVVDGDRDGTVVLDASHGLQPGQTLYLAMAGRDSGELEVLDFTFGRMTLGHAFQVPAVAEEPRRGCATAPLLGIWGWPLLLVGMRRRA